MAQYFTDFDSSEYSLGDITTQGWTHRWEGTPSAEVIDDVDADNGRALEVVADAGSTNMLLSWDAVDDAGRAELDILCRQKINNNSGTVHHGLAGRASGGSTDPTGYAGHQKASSSIQLIRFNSSNSRDDITESGTGGTVTTGLYYFVRLKVSGSNPTTLELTRWEGAVGDEPASPDISYTDDSVDEITQAGWVGFFKRAGQTYTWDWIGVGTDGDPAPTEPVSGGTAVNVDISAGALSFSGATQTVQAGAAPQMGAGSLSFTEQSQTVAAGATADIGAGNLTLSGQALTVTHGVSAQVGAGTLNLTGQSMTVTVGDQQTVSVDISPGTLNLSGNSLTESHGVVTDIGAGTLSMQGLAAQIAAGASIDVQAGTLSITGQSMDSAGGVSIDVQRGNITLSGQAITETYGQALDIGAGTLTLTGQSLSVVIAQIETPDGRTLTIPMDARTLKITADHRDIAIPDDVRSLTIH